MDIVIIEFRTVLQLFNIVIFHGCVTGSLPVRILYYSRAELTNVTDCTRHPMNMIEFIEVTLFLFFIRFVFSLYLFCHIVLVHSTLDGWDTQDESNRCTYVTRYLDIR